MNPMRTERLILRNWQESDRNLFHEINSDPAVMEFFPSRRDRQQADELMDRIAASIDQNGFGFAAVELAGTGDCLGFCGLAKPGLEELLPQGAIEIGWRFAARHWGKGFASESARRWLQFGFDTMELPEIISIAVADNHRSTAVMRRIGMQRDETGDFDHPRVPDDMPHLKRHVLYRLTVDAWRSNG